MEDTRTQKEQEQYLAGALVIGPESPTQERLEVAKLPPHVRTHYFSKPDGAKYDLSTARRQFEMWGFVVAHRIAANDWNYNPPAMDGLSGGRGGRRGSMSDIGDVLLIHAQVEAFLLSLPEAMRRIAVHVYVRQFRQEGRIKYLFADGSEGEWQHEDDPQPLAPWTGVERRDTCFWEAGWRGLSSPEIDAYAAAMGYSRNTLLEQEAKRLLKLYASKYAIFQDSEAAIDLQAKAA